MWLPGGKDWEFGISRHKPLHIGWIKSKGLLYSTGNYIQYPVINHNGKEYAECVCVCVCVCILEQGLPCGSADKESACNAGDLGSIPGLGRSPGEGKGYPLPVFWPGEFHWTV